MNYPDDWLQFSEEYCDDVHWFVLQVWPNFFVWPDRIVAEFENMLLMGGEMG